MDQGMDLSLFLCICVIQIYPNQIDDLGVSGM